MELHVPYSCERISLLLSIIEETLSRKKVCVGPVCVRPLSRWSFLSALSSEKKQNSHIIRRSRCLKLCCRGIFLSVPSSYLHCLEIQQRNVVIFTLENSHAYLLAVEGRADTSQQHLCSASLPCMRN